MTDSTSLSTLIDGMAPKRADTFHRRTVTLLQLTIHGTRYLCLRIPYGGTRVRHFVPKQPSSFAPGTVCGQGGSDPERIRAVFAA